MSIENTAPERIYIINNGSDFEWLGYPIPEDWKDSKDEVEYVRADLVEKRMIDFAEWIEDGMFTINGIGNWVGYKGIVGSTAALYKLFLEENNHA